MCTDCLQHATFNTTITACSDVVCSHLCTGSCTTLCEETCVSVSKCEEMEINSMEDDVDYGNVEFPKTNFVFKKRQRPC